MKVLFYLHSGRSAEDPRKIRGRPSSQPVCQAAGRPSQLECPALQPKAIPKMTNNPRRVRGGCRGGYEWPKLLFLAEGPFSTSGQKWGSSLCFSCWLRRGAPVLLLLSLRIVFFNCGRICRIRRRDVSVLGLMSLRINLKFSFCVVAPGSYIYIYLHIYIYMYIYVCIYM